MSDAREDAWQSPPTALPGPNGDRVSTWDAFWFAPVQHVDSGRWSRWSGIRILFSGIAAVYFVTCFSDLSFWFSSAEQDVGVLAPARVATIVRTGGLQGDARWIVSPLYLTGWAPGYAAYLVLGIGVCSVVAFVPRWRIAIPLLWLLVVGWANRLMIVSGLGETLLSLGLFCLCVGAIGPKWTSHFAQRLMALQFTVIGLATTATMLAGRVWWNGLGSYTLVAPAPDRTMDFTESLMIIPVVHESLSHGLLVGLPVGIALAWTSRWHRQGLSVIMVWCLTIAVLGSLWMHAAALATMALAIVPPHKKPAA